MRKIVGGYVKLLYPDGVFTKEQLEEILVFALEMRRRVKEQLKKLGGMEFYDVNFSYIDLDTFGEKFDIQYRSVMGVELPTVKLDAAPEPEFCYGFAGTNSQLDYAYLCFHKVKLMTAQLAEIENSIYRLANAIKKTQSRANALKNIIIPNFEYSSKFITDALEEKEREEFSRLKVIKAQKLKKEEEDAIFQEIQELQEDPVMAEEQQGEKEAE